MTISWLFSLQLWMVLDGVALNAAYALVDVMLAVAFYRMAEAKWFPAPLAILHCGLVGYHLYAGFIETEIFWMAIIVNRFFEACIIYIIICALFRISRRRHIHSV
ncbi:hypothetical protein [Hyphococcus sp.]|uniref:hypothetical protein n=1 Tax=Hyphococcus sp. TaxID=2038636 RepID=UPI003CCBBB4D